MFLPEQPESQASCALPEGQGPLGSGGAANRTGCFQRSTLQQREQPSPSDSQPRTRSASLPQLHGLRPLQTPHLTEAQKREASLPRLQLQTAPGQGSFKFTGNAPSPSIPECRELICSLAEALTAAFQLLRPPPPILMNLFNCYARRNLIKLLYIMLRRSSTVPSLPAGPTTWPKASYRS